MLDIPVFLEAIRETLYYVFYATKLFTGLRRGELLALRWCNVDLDIASLSVVETAFKLSNGEYIVKEPKTSHSRRTVALPPSLALLLRQYRSDQEKLVEKMGGRLSDLDFVFARPDGKPLDPNTVTRTFSKAI